MYLKKNALIGLITINAITLFAVVFVVAQSITGSGQPVPNYLNYQGKLTDPSTGQPIPDGNHNVTFRICDAETGGSTLWNDTYLVETKNGLFNQLLGPIDASVFDDPDRWVEIEVDGETISTRQRIVSVAYAIRATSAGNADTLEGKPASEFAAATHSHDGLLTAAQKNELTGGGQTTLHSHPGLTNFKFGTAKFTFSEPGPITITGLGFQPRVVQIFTTSGPYYYSSMGISDGTNNSCVFNGNNASTGVKTNKAWYIQFNSDDRHEGVCDNFDPDGFRLNNTVVHVPNDIFILWIAYK